MQRRVVEPGDPGNDDYRRQCCDDDAIDDDDDDRDRGQDLRPRGLGLDGEPQLWTGDRDLVGAV